MRISDKISDAEFFRRKAEEVAFSNRGWKTPAEGESAAIDWSQADRAARALRQSMLESGPKILSVLDWNGNLTFHAEKLSLTGANEHLCAIIHRALCRLSPIDGLANHHAALAQLSPMDVVQIAEAITHPAVQSGDVAGIMAMRVPQPAPETAIPAVKASPQGLGAMTGMDHRLGSWK